MKSRLLAPFCALALLGCTSYHPLDDPSLRKPIDRLPAANSGIKVTFLGNTTLHLADGETSLLVDGFLSRPGVLKTLLGRIGPDREIIRAELDKAGIDCVDAVLVGHAHHDHALDATAIADLFGAQAVGSESYAQIYRGSHAAGAGSQLVVIPPGGRTLAFGRFSILFAPSAHVGSHSIVQRAVEGRITAPLAVPAHFSKFNCGDVFALHIAHPEGRVVVTTTAGAKPGQLQGRKADAVFLGVGLLSKESAIKQDFYWRETVETTDPEVIVPIHWDNFTRKLSRGLKPTALAGNPRKIMDIVKRKAGRRHVRVLDQRESVSIRRGQIYFSPSVR